MSKKTLLVTGSGGLVGSEIVALLHNDFDHVFCVFDKDTHANYDEAITKSEGLNKQKKYKKDYKKLALMLIYLLRKIL